MNNPEESDMTEQTNISSKLVDDLTTSRVNLMEILKTVTEPDFLMGLSADSVIGEQQGDSIVTLLVHLAHQEEKSVSFGNEEIPKITEPPQAIHYLLGVRWDTNRIIKSNTSIANLEIVIKNIIDRENAVAQKIASRPKTPRPIEIPVIDTN